ncbi:unnamed protein product [Rotaria sordida]|uniref:Fibronectin type-III domain-containing protein n=1 Tax=Rotaria sordida TaxID=392033 RepID=A0A815NXU1_9BILA|nr:unnamed protein product [Rotaria sordida]CAF1440743.1 unnamed protein product [Rotaria sordida]
MNIQQQYKTTTCQIQWTPLTGYFIECRLQEDSHWSKKTLTEPIEDTATKIYLLHTGHKYKCHIRARNLTDLGELSNSTKETKIRELIIHEKSKFIQELELMTIINVRSVILTGRVEHDPTSEFR